MVVEAFRKLQAVFSRNEGRWSLLHEIVEGRAILPPNLKHIGKAFRGNKHSACPRRSKRALVATVDP